KQLLTLSMLEGELNVEDFIAFDISHKLKEVIATTEWQWRKKNLTIEMDVMPLQIIGEPKLLQQVWMNLITNAIRYTESEETITVRTNRSQYHVQIPITDNVIVISEADLAHRFERFYKVDKARTRTENSTGLGLA